jgi:hypothetical protein
VQRLADRVFELRFGPIETDQQARHLPSGVDRIRQGSDLGRCRHLRTARALRPSRRRHGSAGARHRGGGGRRPSSISVAPPVSDTTVRGPRNWRYVVSATGTNVKNPIARIPG